MALLLPDRAQRRPEGAAGERLNRRGSLEPGDPGRPPRSLVVALVVTCLALMAVDHLGEDGSPIDPVRRVVGEVVGPAQAAADAVAEPLLAVPRWLRGRSDLLGRIEQLEAEKAQLEHQLRTATYDRNRLQEYDDLTATADQLGYALVPARVISIGPAQSFSRTVTLDAGTDAGLTTDLTVLNSEGLVGRIIRTTETTSTVLLAIDSDSVVGGRIGQSMELGFLRGDGDLGSGGRLSLELVDQRMTPRQGDTVVTWGSEGGAPYVTGVPVGTIEAVREDVRDSTRRAVVTPFVDFSALDVVGVVVPGDTASDRATIDSEGRLR